ncbi:MAG: hypothetical protein Ta2B_08880 [Termitinemataceae bacterium]|nr:MAG: hypothetical protein Ta2B_08880 [Termitinemataceae bacterium]
MGSAKKPSIFNNRGAIGTVAELDEYGVWVKSEPQDYIKTSTDNLNYSGGSASDDDFSGKDLGQEPFDLDFDANEYIATDTESKLEMDNLPDFNSGADAKNIDLQDSDTQTPFTSSDTSSESELSTELLLKIANELSSIKNEIKVLKDEFKSIKHVDESETGIGTPIAPENLLPSDIEAEKESAQKNLSGFFDSDDTDETIALTGDELNNILSSVPDFDNTAEIEEASNELADSLLVESDTDIGLDISTDQDDDGQLPPLDLNMNIEGTQDIDVSSIEVGGETEQSTAQDIDINLEIPESQDEAISPDASFDLDISEDLVPTDGSTTDIPSTEENNETDQDLLGVEIDLEDLADENRAADLATPDIEINLEDLADENSETDSSATDMEISLDTPIVENGETDSSATDMEISLDTPIVENSETDSSAPDMEISLDTPIVENGETDSSAPDMEISLDTPIVENSETDSSATDMEISLDTPIVENGETDSSATDMEISLDTPIVENSETDSSAPDMEISLGTPIEEDQSQTQDERFDLDILAEDQQVADEAAAPPDIDINLEIPNEQEEVQSPDIGFDLDVQQAQSDYAESGTSSEALSMGELDAVLNSSDITEQAISEEVVPDDNVAAPDISIDLDLNEETEEASPIEGSGAFDDFIDSEIAGGIDEGESEVLSVPFLSDEDKAAFDSTSDFDPNSFEASILNADQSDIALPPGPPSNDQIPQDITVADEALSSVELDAILSTSDISQDEKIVTTDTNDALEPSVEPSAESENETTEQDMADIEMSIDEAVNNYDQSKDIEKKAATQNEIKDDGNQADGAPSGKFKKELQIVLSYMDQLLEALPEEKIEEFARSDQFETYKKVFKDLGLV